MFLLRVISRFDMVDKHRAIIVSVVLGIIMLFGSVPIGAAKRPLRPDSIMCTLITASPRNIPVFKTVDSILTEMKISKYRYTYLGPLLNLDTPGRFLPDELMIISVYYSVIAPPFNMDYITKYNGRKYIVDDENGDLLVDKIGKKIQLKLSDYDTLLFLDRLLYPIVLVVKTNGDIVVLTKEDEDYYRFVE